MFAPTRNTRLLLCRLGFLALCLLPTLGLSLWATWLRMPGYTETWRVRLADHLRVQVRLFDATHPRPGLLRLHGLDLRDPETRRPLLKIQQLDIDGRGEVTVLVADGMELTDVGLAWLWRTVEDTLRRTPSGDGGQVRLFASSLVVREGHHADRLTEVLAQLQPTPLGPQAAVSFRVDGLDMPRPAVFKMQRNRQIDPPATGIRLDTSDAPLPVRLAGPLMRWTSRLGRRATFQGSLEASRLASGWQGEMEGRFTEVDLEHALANALSHGIIGPTELHIEQARFNDSQLRSLMGSVHAGPGLVDRGLLESASRALQLPMVRFTAEAPRQLPYDELAFSFTIDSGGVSLRGLCSGDSPGAMMADGTQVLIFQPPARQPLHGLGQLIEPASPTRIPPSGTATRHFQRPSTR